MMKKMGLEERQQLITAMSTDVDERSIAMRRVINKAADMYENIGINDEVTNVDWYNVQSAIDSLGSLAHGVRNPEVLRELMSTWLPGRTDIRVASSEIYAMINKAGWGADHHDEVEEKYRREQYAKREQFYEATVAIMVVKFSSMWGRLPLSAIVVSALYEKGCLDFVLNGKGYGDDIQPSVSGLFSVLDKWHQTGVRPIASTSTPDALLVMMAKSEVGVDQSVDLDRFIPRGGDINQTPKPDVQWLVEGVIPKTVDVNSPYVGFLYGNSSTYKSFIATGICAAIARGKDGAAGFAGLAKVNGAPGKVMYLSGEDSYGIRIRFEAEAGGIVPDCVRMNLNELDSVFSEDGNFDPAIVRCVIEHEPDLIVMDTMNSLKLCDNNNSSASVSKMMHKLKELGTTVMVIHHTTKSGDSMEGSHAMTSNADFIMRTDIVEREDDIPVVDLSCGKLKNAAKFKPMRIELVEQGEALVCRNHKVYEIVRETEAKELGLDPTLLRLIIESGETGITVPQLSNHKDVNWKHSRQHLIGTLDKNIDDMVDGWADVVKVSSPGVATRYILGAKYKAKL